MFPGIPFIDVCSTHSVTEHGDLVKEDDLMPVSLLFGPPNEASKPGEGGTFFFPGSQVSRYFAFRESCRISMEIPEEC